MNVIIIEDEKPAAEKLQKDLQQADASVAVLALLNNCREAIEWLSQHEGPDLIFMDIALTDGLSFTIFDKVQVTCPVIFCTAFDDYWQEAFEHNSIDYLLKPVKPEKLQAALQKYDKLKQYFSRNLTSLTTWHHQQQASTFKKRFLVKRGADYISVKAEEIAYLYAAHKLVCMVDNTNRKFILDCSLSDIEKQLDPQFFFRVNRKYLVNQNAIKKIKASAKSKLELDLEPAAAEEIIVSQENAAAFKAWMDS